MTLETIIRKFVLKNAHEYGKASPKAVAGKVIAASSEAKTDLKKTMQLIQEMIREVETLSKEQIENELKGHAFVQKEEGPRVLRLEDAEEGKVITRFLPEPNGWMHLGHAKAAFLSMEAAQQFKGSCHLRFDDTNPETEKQEYEDAIREDLNWLGLTFSKETHTSDLMSQFQQFISKLLILGRAYVCTCTQEHMNTNRYEKKVCNCRERRGGEQLVLWQRMQKGDAEKGEMVVRLKGDMKSDNTAMRDPTLFRINKTAHYRLGNTFNAWPTYDFSVSIADSIEDVTHALRSKEYELRDELYDAILTAVNLRKPRVYDFARLKMKGTALSKRFLKPLIEQGKVHGWNDPRLPTLRGMKRRGILPEAIKEFVMSLGLSKQESQPSFDQLLQINRRCLDPMAEHYFFVSNPFKLTIPSLTEKQTHGIPKRGNSKGNRGVAFKNAFWLSKSDVQEWKEGLRVRLKDLFDVKISALNENEIAGEFVGKEPASGAKVVQWVSAMEGESVPCSVIEIADLLNDKDEFNPESWRETTGVCEKECRSLKEGAIIQFERTGFCRLDEKRENQLTFIKSG